MHMLYIDVPGINAHTAHRLVLATLTHYGFQSITATTKQGRKVARVKVLARLCTGDLESASALVVSVLPKGARVGVDCRSPFMH